MESSRKRLGFIKGKLVKSLYRAGATPKPSSGSSNRVPNYPSEGLVVNQLDCPSIIHHLNDHQQPKQKLVPYNPNSTTVSSFSSTTTTAVDYTLNQEQVTVPQKPKVSFYIPPFEEYSAAYYDNESVDLKAANYISSVQERFRLERISSEHSHSHEEVLQLHQ